MAEKLISMFRDADEFPEGPHTADVHPDEAEAMQTAGWRVLSSASSLKPTEADGGDPQMGYGKPKPKPRPKG